MQKVSNYFPGSNSRRSCEGTTSCKDSKSLHPASYTQRLFLPVTWVVGQHHIKQPYSHIPAIQEMKTRPQLSAGLVLCFYFLKGLKYEEPSLYCIINYFFSLDVFLCLILFISLPHWLCVTSLKPLLFKKNETVSASFENKNPGSHALTTLMLWNWWGKSQCRRPLSCVCACVRACVNRRLLSASPSRPSSSLPA